MKFLKYIALTTIAVFTLQSCNLLSSAGIISQGPTVKVEGKLTSTTANSSVNVNHSAWDKLLKKHVDKNGLVDYKGFINDREALNGYLQNMSSMSPNNEWSVQELLAYYINVYNAYTVDAILNNYPTESIKDINNVWKGANVPIGDRMLPLAGIENGILRKMNEPRIHFAINCASISCPKLLNEAYTAAKINEQLELVTINFINGSKNELSKNSPKISSIFKFYPKDFKVNGEQNIIGYINNYSKIKINPNATLQYLDYDWNLNEQ